MKYHFNMNEFHSLTGVLNLDDLTNTVRLDSGISSLILGSSFVEPEVIFEFSEALSEDSMLQLENIVTAYAGVQPENEVEKYRNHWANFVDARAEEIRSRFLSYGVGMIYVYAMKVDEAKEFLQAQAPAPEDFPLIFGEANARGITEAQMAQEILNQFQLFKQKMADIENVRIGFKVQVQTETDPANMEGMALIAKSVLESLWL